MRSLSSLFTAAVFVCATFAMSQTAAPNASQAKSGATQQSSSDQEPAAVARIPIPALPAFHPAQPTRITLANGATIFLIEDHELPLIDFTAQFYGGSRDESAAKVGLADIFGDVWRTGGTTSKTGDQIDDLLEMRAAKLETGAGAESTYINGNCLKGDFDTVFNLMMEFIRSPQFREDKIELAKNDANTGISRRNDDAGQIASREAVRIAYGKDNPYARIPEYSTIAAITRDDLVAWQKQYIHPNNMIFGIVGDFDTAQMEAKLRQAFGALPRGPKYLAPKIDFQPPKPGIYFVEKDDINQSQVRMVSLGTERKNPDYVPLSVMNEAFGGGFASRLFSRIRTKQGLAYSVGGAYGAGWDHPGLFEISTSTRSGSTVATINAINAEIENATKEPFTSVEVKRAKDGLLNGFIFRLDTKEKVLRERMTYDFYGYPSDFLEKYRDGVERSDASAIDRVADKYIKDAKLAIVVVGNSKDFDKPLSTLGTVTPIDITIPAPASEAASATPAPKQSTPEGKALLAKTLAWLGGEQKLAAVRSVHYEYTASINTPNGAMELQAESWAVLPDRAKQVMNTPMGPMTTVVTPANSFAQRGGQTMQLPKEAADQYLEGLHRSSYYVARHASDPAWVFYSEADALHISGEGHTMIWHVDPATGELRSTEYQTVGQTGPVTRIETFSNYKPVNGIQVAHSISTTENGKPAYSATISKYEIDPAIDPSVFAAPSAATPK